MSLGNIIKLLLTPPPPDNSGGVQHPSLSTPADGIPPFSRYPDFVKLSVVEVRVSYCGVNVFHVCLDFCVVDGVGVCVVCCLFLASGCCLLVFLG